MIETEEQRRWWFATHPEFSWSRKATRPRETETKDEARPDYSPEDVDAYVDESLKYETGTVADLLRSIKRWFGTEGNSQEQDPKADLSEWKSEAGGRTGRSDSRRGHRSRRGGRQPREWFDIPRHLQEAMDTIEAELERAGADPRDYRLTWFEFSGNQGRIVAARDSIFDPYQRDSRGRTNIERMEKGLTPYDRSYDYVVIHHSGQRDRGPLIELTSSEHGRIPVRQDRSEINRSEFAQFREKYWRHRAQSLFERLNR